MSGQDSTREERRMSRPPTICQERRGRTGVPGALGGLLSELTHGSSASTSPGAGGAAGAGGARADEDASAARRRRLSQTAACRKPLPSFTRRALSSEADSWVGKGANEPISADQLKKALGDGPIADIAQKLWRLADDQAGECSCPERSWHCLSTTSLRAASAAGRAEPPERARASRHRFGKPLMRSFPRSSAPANLARAHLPRTGGDRLVVLGGRPGRRLPVVNERRHPDPEAEGPRRPLRIRGFIWAGDWKRVG